MRTRNKIISIIATIMLSASLSIFTSALEYRSSADVSFTINPSVSVSLSSSDLVIPELAPSTSADSNVITVTVATNSRGGYTLSGAVGNGDSTTDYDTTDLVNMDNSDYIFSSVAIDASLSSLSTPGTWGYATSADSFATYSGLPQYGVDSKVLASNLGPITDTLGFKIAALAEAAQIAGDYRNYINFTAVAEPEPVTYIQDLTLAQCQVNVGTNGNPANVGDELTVTDSRDGKTYTVRYINGACWMTQNLAIEPGTHMNESNTNITSAQYNNANFYTLPGDGYDLRANGGSGDNCYGSGSSGTGYTNACTHVANAADVSEAGSAACGGSECTTQQLGAWYNYAAATAETIKGTSTSTVDTYNICPRGWTLPSRDTSSPAGSTNSIVSYASSFNLLYGGRYSQGSHSLAATNGLWWSSAANTTVNRYSLNYNNGSLDAGSNNSRSGGYYVRCVRTT